MRGISIKLQEEERERRDNYMPEVSAVDPDAIDVLSIDADTKAMHVFVMDEATQTGLRVRPPIRIRDIEWDGGSAETTVTEHVVKISSKDTDIETIVPHGDAKDPEWRFMVRARVQNAVEVLASKSK